MSFIGGGEEHRRPEGGGGGGGVERMKRRTKGVAEVWVSTEARIKMGREELRVATRKTITSLSTKAEILRQSQITLQVRRRSKGGEHQWLKKGHDEKSGPPATGSEERENTQQENRSGEGLRGRGNPARMFSEGCGQTHFFFKSRRKSQSIMRRKLRRIGPRREC